MRTWLLTGLLLAAAGALPAQEGQAPFAAPLPAGIGDVSRWEIVAGSYETEGERGAYRLYVNPQRAGVYQLMRFRVELLRARTPEEEARGSAEGVAFIRRPGVREPMDCWVRLEGGDPGWRSLVAGTPEYLAEIGTVMHVLSIHRRSLMQPMP